MARFVGGRLVDAIPVLLLSSLLVFAVLHLVPGDPVDAMMGAASFGISTPESQAKLVAQIRDQLGLNDPLPLQYLHWLGNALHLDLGESFIRHQSVSSLIAQRLPTTLELAGAALLLSVIVGMAMGIVAALKRNTPIDGLQVGRLLAGSIIVETVFARQGVGQLAIDAIQTKDYPLVQGIILLTASGYVLANLLVDISYGFINPKIRTA